MAKAAAAPAPNWATTAVDTAVEFAKKSSTLPIGAALGLSAGIALTSILYYTPGRVVPLWLLSLSIPFCVATGIGVQKFLHWKYGWKVETELRGARIKRDTGLKLRELRDRVAAGVFTAEQAQRIGAQIAREGLLGPPELRGPRAPRWRKLPTPPIEPPEASGHRGESRENPGT